jgi:hypothetical protein
VKRPPFHLNGWLCSAALQVTGVQRSGKVSPELEIREIPCAFPLSAYAEAGDHSGRSHGPSGRFMSNDKKPKKAKPPVVHGATSRGSDLASKLADPKKAAAPAKKKK